MKAARSPHRLEKRGAEFRAAFHQVQEHVRLIASSMQSVSGHGGGEARPAVDERHFAEEDSAPADFFDQRIADADRDAPFEHREQGRAQLAFGHDDPSRRVAETRAGPSTCARSASSCVSSAAAFLHLASESVGA